MKTDIEARILRIEEAHDRDMQEVRAEMHSISNRVDSGEASLSSLENRVSALERAQTFQATTAVYLQLHLEDLSC